VAFSGCQPVAVIKDSLITAVDGKATAYRAEYGREPYDRGYELGGAIVGFQ
jgi:hypothetical protein